MGKTTIFLAVGCALALGVVVASQKVPAIRLAIETDIPQITISSLPASGYGTRQFQVKVEDSGAGLKGVKVEAMQDGKVTELVANALNGEKAVEIPVNVTLGKDLKEGRAAIVVTAVDATLRGNTASQKEEFILDAAKPSIDVLTLQHVVAEGGAELLIFKVKDTNLKEVGVAVGDVSYPAFPAKDLDPRLSDKDLYAAFFALPFEFKAKGMTASVVAKDEAENISKAPLLFRVDQKKQKEPVMALKESYLSAKAEELYPGYRALLVSEGKDTSATDALSAPEKFRVINADYRARLDAKLKEIARASNTPKQWTEVFMKPMPSATSSSYGEKRSYTFGDLGLGHSIHNGVDLAATQRHPVHAANDGIVVLAREFGIYGNAVVIDHGLGIFTLYGHLSTVDVKEGEKVTKAQLLGKTGQTGLAGGDHLHFEFRLFETPLSPIEWWDAKWMKDNIDGKVADVLAMTQEHA